MSDQLIFLPHQLEAIKKLRSGSILCAGVGTGKSITALGYFYGIECKAVQWEDGAQRGPMLDPKPLYIITTARKRDTHEWDRECDRFDFQGISIVVDSWNNLHKYEKVSGAFFIFDEQRVVGSGAWTKSFQRISLRNRWILLSATPGDTWMDYIPVFLANGFYRNRTEFLRRHAVYNRYSKYPKIDRWLETGHLERLRRSITVTMEFEKKTVCHYNDIFVEYDHELYDTVIEKRWNPFDNEPVRDISGACYLMRKVVNSSKQRLDEIQKLIEDHPKLIVFYNYDYELELLKTLENYIPQAEWNGHHHEFIPSTKRWMYLVQYNAGAEGWNCVETDTIIFFSQSYSYKLMTQAAGRIDRMNTPFVDLYYYTLKTNASIDKSISRALRNKKSFNLKLFAKASGLDLPEKA